MKTWHKVALVVLNLALLPVTWAFVARESNSVPPIYRFYVILPVLHIAATALAVNLYLLPRKLRERRGRVIPPVEPRL